jgi:CDP-diacylglycerol--serine O-phosphatidyltransferase
MNSPFRRRKEDQLLPRRQRKGMYILPSLFTIGNLAAGFYAILQALQGTVQVQKGLLQDGSIHFDYAAIAIGFAVLFDGLDGTIARLTNTTSDFGRELDSLADVVTFGVAPAVLAWMWGFHNLPMDLDHDLRLRIVQFGAALCFLFLAAGASRLARFNIQVNPQPSNPGRPGRKYFVGMPIPGGAGCIAATVHFATGYPITIWWLSVIWLSFVLVLAFLMVSTWRFWSAKSIDFGSRHPFRLVILLGAAVALIWFFSRYVLFFLALFYLLSGVFARLSFAVRRNPPPATPAETSSH